MSTLNEMKEAMEIFAKYVDGDNVRLEANHDIIFGPGEAETEDMLEEDIIRLDQLGWHFSEHYDCWACNV